jgi:hypothetical protein
MNSSKSLKFEVKVGVICCAAMWCCTKFKSIGAECTRRDSDGPNGPNKLT